MSGKPTLPGKPALYGLLALSAMEVVASQPSDSPLALLQQPNKSFDASTLSQEVASSKQLPRPSTPSIESFPAPRFAPAGFRLTPASKPIQHRSTPSVQAAIASTTHFQDVQAHWSQPFVELLAVRGIVSGYSDGTFQPDRQIEAAHFGSMLQRAKLYRLKALRRELGIVPASERDLAESKLLTASALPTVSETEATQLLQTYDIRTRAQAAVFIYRNFQYQNVLHSTVSHGAMNSKLDPVKQTSMRSPSSISIAKEPRSIPLQRSSDMSLPAQFSNEIL